MAKIKLKAEKRTLTGRKVKKLRAEGVLPVNVYGKDIKSVALQVDLSEFAKVYKQAGETNLVEIVVDRKTRPVLVHEIQTDPVTDEYLHADFLQVNLKVKVKAQVPVEIVGEAPAVKDGLGSLIQQVDEVEVEALPTDLPDKFEVDVSVLKALEDTVTVSNIKSGNKVEVLSDGNQIIAKVEAQREEEEEPAPVVEDEEGEAADGEQVEGEAKEGEEGSEGATDSAEGKEKGSDQSGNKDKGGEEKKGK